MKVIVIYYFFFFYYHICYLIVYLSLIFLSRFVFTTTKHQLQVVFLKVKSMSKISYFVNISCPEELIL